jgi:hypothetical protein
MTIDCHARLHQPPDHQWRGERPEAEEGMEQIEGAAAAGRIEVEDEPVRAAVDRARPEAERQAEGKDKQPARHDRDPRQAERD